MRHEVSIAVEDEVCKVINNQRLGLGSPFRQNTVPAGKSYDLPRQMEPGFTLGSTAKDDIATERKR